MSVQVRGVAVIGKGTIAQPVVPRPARVASFEFGRSATMPFVLGL